LLSGDLQQQMQQLAVDPTTDFLSEDLAASTNDFEQQLAHRLDLNRLQKNTLALRFVGASWLEVRNSDGEVVFSGLKKPGEVLELKSASYFDIMLGDVAAVAMTLNESAVDLAGYKGKQGVIQMTVGR